MIYLLYGNDIQTSRKKLHTLLDGLFKKRPDAEYFHITSENASEFSVEELISSQGLFEQKYIVVLDNLFEDKAKENNRKDELLKELKEMQKAEHIFIFLEGKLDKKTLTRFEKYAEKVQECSVDEKKKERFNTFSLTDALGKRDRKSLWTLYQKAKVERIADEEIHGILFWQVKSMLLALQSSNAKEAGLNPFVFSKSKGFLKNYSEKELRGLSQKLVALSHDARRGIHEFGVALERFILAL
jgi:DNA polymerase III delta subunit